MSCRDTNYPNNVFNPYQIQYQIVQLINTAKAQVTEFESHNSSLVHVVLFALSDTEKHLQTEPMFHKDVLRALDSLKLTIEPMVQLRRIFVISKESENLLKIMALCQLVNCLVTLTEVLHTLSHIANHKAVDKDLFRTEMDAIFQDLGIDAGE